MAAVAPSTIFQMCCKTAWPRDMLEDRYPFSHHLGTDNKDETSLFLHTEIWVNIHQSTVISHLVGYTLENSKRILRFEVFVAVLLQMWPCVVGWEDTDILKDHFYSHFTQTALRLLDSEAAGTVISQNTGNCSLPTHNTAPHPSTPVSLVMWLLLGPQSECKDQTFVSQ